MAITPQKGFALAEDQELFPHWKPKVLKRRRENVEGPLAFQSLRESVIQAVPPQKQRQAFFSRNCLDPGQVCAKFPE